VSGSLNDMEIRLSTDTKIPVFQKIYISLTIYISDKVALILYVHRNIKNDKIYALYESYYFLCILRKHSRD